MIGQNQNAEEEINHAFVEAHGIRVVRRMTGGGAVYHDLGNLNYSWMTDVENAGAITYQQFTRPVVEALRGRLFQRADVAQALRGLPLQNYLGGIREQEVLDTMFPVSGPKSEAPSF